MHCQQCISPIYIPWIDYCLEMVSEASRTNSKSADNLSFVTIEFCYNEQYSLIDRVKVIINTAAPDFLPFFKIEPGYTRNEVTTWQFHTCDGQQKSNQDTILTEVYSFYRAEACYQTQSLLTADPEVYLSGGAKCQALLRCVACS